MDFADFNRQVAVLGGVAVVQVAFRAEGGMFMVRNLARTSRGFIERLGGTDDVYIRRAAPCDHPFVLVDDIDMGTIDKMVRDGIAPAISIETSHENYQAVIRFVRDLPPSIRKSAARALVKKYGGDLGSADADHFFRAAGFNVSGKPAALYFPG
ncbi:DNA-primase RepB domain-containing protein [Ferrovum myxofaciens]|uniref:DNA-primase RepB domain-containing protein n=1 Tax=Ferrovum myxofaciens TaxID=416213 RepID=UPI003EB8C5BF